VIEYAIQAFLKLLGPAESNQTSIKHGCDGATLEHKDASVVLVIRIKRMDLIEIILCIISCGIIPQCLFVVHDN
jgi:hypothetical protein